MSSQMTARERVLAAIQGLPHDRTPLISPVSLANTDCMRHARAWFPYANTNPQKMADLAQTSFTALQFDSIMPYFGTTHELSALGCQVSWGGSEQFSAVYGGTLPSLEAFRMPTDYLDSKSIRVILDAIALLKARHGQQAAIVGKIIGPLSLMFYLFGVQNMLNALILEPETTVQVLREMKELCIAFALAQVEAGADLITVSEDAAGEMISREGYRKLVMDTERQIFRALEGETFVTFHLSGNIMDRADLFRDTGFHALSFDSRNDLPRLRAVAGEMKLIGGVNNPGTLLNGSREQVAKEVCYALDNGVALVAPECAIPLRVPNRNLQAMRDAVLQYEKRSKGRKPQ